MPSNDEPRPQATAAADEQAVKAARRRKGAAEAEQLIHEQAEQRPAQRHPVIVPKAPVDAERDGASPGAPVGGNPLREAARRHRRRSGASSSCSRSGSCSC